MYCLEALIGLMAPDRYCILNQLYDGANSLSSIKAMLLDAAATQLMDLQASAAYPQTINKLPSEEFQR